MSFQQGLKTCLIAIFFSIFLEKAVKGQETSVQPNSSFKLQKVIALENFDLPYPNTEIKFLGDKFRIVDFGDQNIKSYSKSGKLIKEIGRRGRGPGEFMRLGFIDVLPQKDAMVALDLNKRVTFFDSAETPYYSFILSQPHHNFDIAFVNESQNLVIGGLSFNSSNFSISGNSFAAHLYTSEGKYLRSFHNAVELSAEKMRLYAVNMNIIVKTDNKGSIYVAQPLKYEIIKYNSQGKKPVEIISNAPDYVQIVDEALPLDAINKRKLSDFWFEEHRHLLHSFFIFNGGIAVVAKTFYPTMYAIDIYDRDGNLIKANIKTDQNLRGIDGKGIFYFSDFKRKKGYQLYLYELNKAIQKELLN